MVVLGKFGVYGTKDLIQWLPRSVTKGGTNLPNGITVALCTDFQLPLSGQIRGSHNFGPFKVVWLGLVVGHMLFTRAVAPFTSHPQKKAVRFVPIP